MQDRVSKIVERSNSANTEPANKASLRDAGALIAEAQEGVRVRLVYDRMGGPGKTSRKSWNLLRAGGVEVRYYNPPQFD